MLSEEVTDPVAETDTVNINDPEIEPDAECDALGCIVREIVGLVLGLAVEHPELLTERVLTVVTEMEYVAEFVYDGDSVGECVPVVLTEAVSHTDILDDEDALREPDGECDDESEEEIDGDDDTDEVLERVELIVALADIDVSGLAEVVWQPEADSVPDVLCDSVIELVGDTVFDTDTD